MQTPALTTRRLHRQVKQGHCVSKTANGLPLSFRKGLILGKTFHYSLILKCSRRTHTDPLSIHLPSWSSSSQTRRHSLVAKLHLCYNDLLNMPEDISFCRWLLSIFRAMTNTDGCNITNVLWRKLKRVCCSPTRNKEQFPLGSWRLAVTCLIWTLGNMHMAMEDRR